MRSEDPLLYSFLSGEEGGERGVGEEGVEMTGEVCICCLCHVVDSSPPEWPEAELTMGGLYVFG